MKKKYSIICLLLIMVIMTAGCTSGRYNTQKGAALGAALGATYGQAIGRDTEGTLIGTALGGLAGAVIGNYEDQRRQYERSYRAPVYLHQPPPAYSRAPQDSYSAGQWVVVPGQYIGNQYVPPHQVWVPSQGFKGIIVER